MKSTTREENNSTKHEREKSLIEMSYSNNTMRVKETLEPQLETAQPK